MGHQRSWSQSYAKYTPLHLLYDENHCNKTTCRGTCGTFAMLLGVHARWKMYVETKRGVGRQVRKKEIK